MSQRSDERSGETAVGDGGEHVDIHDVLEHLEDLSETVDSEVERQEVREAKAMIRQLPGRSLFGHRIKKYTTRDIAEGFVGSVIFSLPMLVESGVYDIADHFGAITVGGVPVFFLVNIGFVITMTTGLLYWTDIQHVEITKPLFGVVPRRLVGVLVISFLATALLMTMWGRLENWSDPVLAFYRLSVIWTAAAFGAALGDILPGPSKGTDLNELIERRID